MQEVAREARIGGVEMRDGTHLEHIEEFVEEDHRARYLSHWRAGWQLGVVGVVLPTRTGVIACCREVACFARFRITWGSRRRGPLRYGLLVVFTMPRITVLMPLDALDVGRQSIVEIAGGVL